MESWGVFFLGLIAFASLVQAGFLIGLALAGRRLAQRVDALSAQLDREIKPALENFTRVSRAAAEIADLATLQARRLDLLLADTVEKIEETTGVDPAAGGPPAQAARRHPRVPARAAARDGGLPPARPQRPRAASGAPPAQPHRRRRAPVYLTLFWGVLRRTPQAPLRSAGVNPAPLRACCYSGVLRRTPQAPRQRQIVTG